MCYKHDAVDWLSLYFTDRLHSRKKLYNRKLSKLLSPSTWVTLFSVEFDVHVTVHRDKFPSNKPTRCTNFSNLFWKETLNVSDSFSVHHQAFFTVHTAVVCVVQVCWQHASGLMMFHPEPTCMMTYTIAVCTVKNSWLWTEELPKTCRVSFQNKFEKLVHLVGLL